ALPVSQHSSSSPHLQAIASLYLTRPTLQRWIWLRHRPHPPLSTSTPRPRAHLPPRCAPASPPTANGSRRHRDCRRPRGTARTHRTISPETAPQSTTSPSQL
ncbi:uncharacterized protein CC84DRAFT_1199994, partial [Paraphaeosphaeria sporulosa]